MFNKFTFEKKLGIDSTKEKYKGIKISVVSLLVGVMGAIITLYLSKPLGMFIFYLGFVGVCVGILYGFYLGIKAFVKSE